MTFGNGLARVICLNSISLAAMHDTKIATRREVGTEGFKVVILHKPSGANALRLGNRTACVPWLNRILVSSTRRRRCGRCRAGRIGAAFDIISLGGIDLCSAVDFSLTVRKERRKLPRGNLSSSS